MTIWCHLDVIWIYISHLGSMSFLPLSVPQVQVCENGPILTKFWKIFTRKCWHEQKFCWQNRVFKYFRKLDMKGIRYAKLQDSRTFGSDFNMGGGSCYTPSMNQTYIKNPMKDRFKYQKLSISDDLFFSDLTTSFQFRCLLRWCVCVCFCKKILC